MKPLMFALMSMALAPGVAHAQANPALPRGLYAENAKDCRAAKAGDENFSREVSKDGKRIEAYGSSCSIRSIRQNGTRFTVSLSCDGEGEKWTENTIITVLNTQTTQWHERGNTRRLKLCR